VIQAPLREQRGPGPYSSTATVWLGVSKPRCASNGDRGGIGRRLVAVPYAAVTP
jgi:hypothetical protein